MIAAPHLVHPGPLNSSVTRAVVTALQLETLDAPVQIGPAVVPVSQLLGPVLVGVLLNCFVYGVAFLQWIQYCLGRNRDRPLLKCVLSPFCLPRPVFRFPLLVSSLSLCLVLRHGRGCERGG